MKGLVLSLKPFKQKDRNVLLKNPEYEESGKAEPQRRTASGRGFFRDSQGNLSGHQPSGEVFYRDPNTEYMAEMLERPDVRKPERQVYNPKEKYDMGEISVPLNAVKAKDSENLKKYGMSALFAFVVLLGVIAGTAAAAGIDMDIVKSLEFLMFTNAGEGTNGSLQVFSSAFAVNFIYLTVIFLVGLSPWGMGVIPFVCLFKGFETGLVASYLGVTYEWGMTYYFLIIAPGIFAFAFSMIIQSGYAVRMSSALGKFMFTAQQDSGWIKDNIKDYMYKSGSMMILATAASLVNTVMWTLCSNMFDL